MVVRSWSSGPQLLTGCERVPSAGVRANKDANGEPRQRCAWIDCFDPIISARTWKVPTQPRSAPGVYFLTRAYTTAAVCVKWIGSGRAEYVKALISRNTWEGRQAQGTEANRLRLLLYIRLQTVSDKSPPSELDLSDTMR